jgi:aspartate/glutamate racemase
MNLKNIQSKKIIRLFSEYLTWTGVAHTSPETAGDPRLIGKRLGLLNGSSWITLWANFFGRVYLPEVHLINAGNEAVQINFMQAHQEGQVVPPEANIQAFVRYANDLSELAQVDAILITCSTMNRAYLEVRKALNPSGVPVFQIDQPMMERAIEHGEHVLVVATHGPTVASTHALLQETAEELGKPVSFSGLDVTEAWHRLADGDVEGHNNLLANAIHDRLQRESYDSVGIRCAGLHQRAMWIRVLKRILAA